MNKWSTVDSANAFIRTYCVNTKHCAFIDVNPMFFDDKGNARVELYKDDMLHLKPEVYKDFAAFLKPAIEKIWNSYLQKGK
jgi:hypothetical protein